MIFWTMLAVAGSLSVTPPQQAQATARDQEATTLTDIEVQARLRSRALRQRVETFIDSNMAPPSGRPLARWSKPVCVGTAQLSPQYAQAVINRIALRIIEAGGDVAEPGCKADVMVIGTDDGAAMARGLVKDDPRGYRPARGGTDRGAAALRLFQDADAAIRWWHVSLPVSVDTGEIAIRLDGEEPPTIAVRDASRLRTNVRDDLARVIVIIDFTKTAHIPLGALVDYAAFVALAQVNPDGEPSGQDSILNLFTNPQGVSGMTEWDKEYLAALYRAVPNRPTRSAQARGISDEMIRQRE